MKRQVLFCCIFFLASTLFAFKQNGNKQIGYVYDSHTHIVNESTEKFDYYIELLPNMNFTGSWFFWIIGFDTMTCNWVENPDVSWLTITPSTFTAYPNNIAIKIDFNFTSPADTGTYTTTVVDSNGNWENLNVILLVTENPTPNVIISENISANQLYIYSEIYTATGYFNWGNIFYYYNSREYNFYEIPNVNWLNIIPSYFILNVGDTIDVNYEINIDSVGTFEELTIRDSEFSTFPRYLKFEIETYSNNPPLVSNPVQDLNIYEDFGTVIVADLDTIFSDPDIPYGDSLRYSVTTSSGILNAGVTYRVLQLTSVSDSNGVAQVIVKALDDSMYSASDTFLVFINNVNDPPIFNNLPDSVEFTADSSVTINIWDFIEDIESADSLLTYQFDPVSDSLICIYDSTNGHLFLSSHQLHTGIDFLFITAIDDSGAVATDTMLVFILPQTGISDEWLNQIPEKFILLQNYPNPFNPTTRIRFGLSKASLVKIEMYNMLGQRVEELLNEHKNAGYHTVEFDGNNFSSGVYYYKITTENFVDIKKAILLK